MKLPEGYDANRAQPYPTVICVNGEAGFGPRDGKVSLTSSVCKTKGYKENELIVVECSFNTPTWLNDSSTMNHESYLLKVMLPLSKRRQRPGKMFLLGFGTGGYGALSLLMRRPNAFEAVVAADVPILGGYKAIERPWEVKDLERPSYWGSCSSGVPSRRGLDPVRRHADHSRRVGARATQRRRRENRSRSREENRRRTRRFRRSQEEPFEPLSSSTSLRTTTSIDRAPGSTPRSIGSLQNSRKCHPRRLRDRGACKTNRNVHRPRARRARPAQPPRPRRARAMNTRRRAVHPARPPGRAETRAR